MFVYLEIIRLTLYSRQTPVFNLTVNCVGTADNTDNIGQMLYVLSGVLTFVRSRSNKILHCLCAADKLV